ncbi:MAG: ATP-binding cassette domain-containing protein [Oscillospiraceae bacterium]|nr:ATP-binding cassette domain-containing protein [Oscillospiraceae bacterium]
MPIALNHVSYEYLPGTPQHVAALQDISLNIADGEYIGIMGRTGCGKTTLIQLAAGLLVPTGGQIFLDGKDINSKHYDRKILRRSVGVVFQYPEYQLFETTVEKDVAFGLKHAGLSRTERQQRVQNALETMGFSFEAIRSQSPLALSGGEKRRVAIAGVLAMQPKILIFDEPTAGLDPLGRAAFLRLTQKLNQKGMTILMISQTADDFGEYARRMLVLDSGRVVLDGSTKEVFSDIPRLQKMRLEVSTPRLLAGMLAAKGMPLSQDIVKYDELISALTAQLKGGAES